MKKWQCKTLNLTSGWFQILQQTAKAFRGLETHLREMIVQKTVDINPLRFWIVEIDQLHPKIDYFVDNYKKTHLKQQYHSSWHNFEETKCYWQLFTLYLLVISSSMNRRYRVRWEKIQSYEKFIKTRSQMLRRVECTLPAKFWRLVGCTKMVSR